MCLSRIDVNFVIKVADFGLSESMDTTKDYFRQSQDGIIKLPLKWMATECMSDGVFSEKSDVVRSWEDLTPPPPPPPPLLSFCPRAYPDFPF